MATLDGTQAGQSLKTTMYTTSPCITFSDKTLAVSLTRVSSYSGIRALLGVNDHRRWCWRCINL